MIFKLGPSLPKFGQIWVDFSRTWAEVVRIWLGAGRVPPRLGQLFGPHRPQLAPGSTECGPSSVDVGQKSANFDLIRPGIDGSEPNSTSICPLRRLPPRIEQIRPFFLADICPTLGEIDRIPHNSANFGPLARGRPTLARDRATLARNSPNSIWSKSARIQSSLGHPGG